MNIENKTIVITGASKGLGKAMALHFSQKRANVILVARTETLLNQVQTQIRQSTGQIPLIIPCDISCESDVDRMAAVIQKNYPCVDVLINNAGFGTYQVSEHLSNQEMRRHFEVNFFGTYYCTKALLPLIKQSKSGYILNIGSLFSQIALAENSVYAATKFALAGFSEGLRQELNSYGIKVGLFLPGPMKTSFHDNKGKNTQKSSDSVALDPQKAAEKVEKMICQQKKKVITPYWMLPALKVKSWWSVGSRL
jgi:short-subunit dehydrogenase